jgi:hypothetical protein
MRYPDMTNMRTFIVVLLGAGLIAGVAAARTTVVPRNTTPPTITGTAREGETLTAHNGGWANAPTSFAYQWQRCGGDGSGCADISGANKQTYTVASTDSDHTVRVQVTASNTDGQATASSAPTAQISSRSAPVTTAKPTISGSAVVGEQLTADNGTWTGGVDSFSYQWQRCTASMACTNVDGATAKVYGVRTADVGSSLRVQVTAHNASGSTASAASDTTAVVTANGTPAVTVTTPSSTRNHAPSLSFLSLKRAGSLIYSRYRVCDDSAARVKITERDSSPGKLGYTRHFAVSAKPCKTYSKHWGLVSRFKHGPYTVRLQARDRQGMTSPVRTKTLHFPSL